jgi:hypothetical protein
MKRDFEAAVATEYERLCGMPLMPSPRSSCPHSQAEPVVLSTGELVACVCIACLCALPFDWIQDQRTRAERHARCEHDDEVDITAFGKVLTMLVCTICGRKREA